MRECIIFAVFIFSVYQVQAACVEDLLRLFTQDVAKSELEMNITMRTIVNEIQNTKRDIDQIIENSKQGTRNERKKLEDLEDEAYGKSMVKKKSIADCLESDRQQIKIINITESVLFRLCRADLSLLLVEISLKSVERVSNQLEKKLLACINDFTENCEKEKTCIIQTLEETNNEVNSISSKVQKKLEEIKNKSQICADGKKGVVISMIKEQEDNFNYCADQILNS